MGKSEKNDNVIRNLGVIQRILPNWKQNNQIQDGNQSVDNFDKIGIVLVDVIRQIVVRYKSSS